jgi:hypothetical protein
VSDAREQYMTYARKAEEARLADALDQQKISNVVLAGGASASVGLDAAATGARADRRWYRRSVPRPGRSACSADWLGEGLLPNRRMRPHLPARPHQPVDGEAWTRSEP